MRGVVLVALAATLGNVLQGWDNSTIAGALIYVKKEFNLETKPTLEGLIVAMSLIGATFITTISGTISDWFGRRPMLIISSVMYFLSGLIMLWVPNVYVLLFARLLDGFGVGLAVTLIPVYISETAPSDIRGRLNTLPQFAGSGGMFLSYCMVFVMSLTESPSWRLMVGVLCIPSIIYFVLTVFYLPESPRWLVSKGRMLEAKQVLQRLRSTEDVSGELALLVEGLGTGAETSVEEYLITPENELNRNQEANEGNDYKLYGPDGGLSLVVKPVSGQSTLGMRSRHGSFRNQNAPLMDPLVTLIGSFQENLPEAGSTRNLLLPKVGSINSMSDYPGENEQWEVENQGNDASRPTYNDNLQTPLLSRQATGMDKGSASASKDNILGRPNSSFMQGNAGDIANNTSIGGGWQLVWKWAEKVREDGKREGVFQKVYLHQEGIPGSRRDSFASVAGGGMPSGGEVVQASALVSQSARHSKDTLNPYGPAIAHQGDAAAKGSSWRDLLEPGVKRALYVGVGLQLLQQAAGINGVLYFAPQILKEAGVAVLLSNLGISSTSASLLISALTTFLMLPCIGLSMWLMDISGRRSILLSTIPILIVSLAALILGSLVNMGSVLNATISTTSVVVYLCCFVMGLGVIPNILCSEIFPTRVRGICIAICALAYWIGNMITTYSFPVMLKSMGLAGVFGVYATGCILSWIFVVLKVPETKGMPLEVISEFFALGANPN
ncbi:Monosaccharide-sensing protein 2 [Quillaja saponaria]|uniref:Monosaccharide-sensing protein 2 n=1 Tax=Quillaja saponaria TaxID=32244 RepID=A0AAD7PF25_QUISA|nr:Monosaccharide-sensing protein 2 [Quillaja saponaria]